ncbi:acetoacetate decarboxylase family protein [Paracoccus sulfuroxidans]|uniref:Acetoacetate decarboxylase n=1 Tax=Paracoccus sulfuroxidans TaxID=384678 RepID=A0A562NNW9_9RHOB|nr:acetoacetate decarboxylase family protein [Paracoccus sulfuroxidans]TWI33884.1 acetoacetate decarboxylase [Paracoccus sulfuroxidans]
MLNAFGSKDFVEVEFAGQQVKVPAGGYYDRFRSNPDLEVVARDPAAGNIDFFRRLPKHQAQTAIGPVWTPNFYYRASTVQTLFLASAAKLSALLPEPLQPLKPFPGFGLVALTWFSYHVCDNDPYNEVSIAVVIRQPGSRSPGVVHMIDALRRRTFHAHVLALPVDTEIARLRGAFGYQLPKWLAPIELNIDREVTASILNMGGRTDLALRAPMPRLKQVPSQSSITTNISVGLLNGEWAQTVVQSNNLSFAQRLLPRDVVVERGEGPMSELLDGLGAGRILRFDVVKDTQMALHMPRPLHAFDRN